MRDAYESDKRIMDPEEAAGKTVESVRHDYDVILFRFTDGTFLHGYSRLRYEDASDIDFGSPISMSSAAELELIDQDQFLAWVASNKAETQAAKERQEREEFERLSKKFTPITPEPARA